MTDTKSGWISSHSTSVDTTSTTPITRLLVALALLLLGLTRPFFSDFNEQSSTSTQPQTNAAAGHVTGIDVSHHQGNIDWQAVQKQGNVDFVFLKLTDGVTYTDPTYKNHVESLAALGVPFGSYHFFEPLDRGVDQAQHFLKELHTPPILRPVLDIEISKGVARDVIQREVETWLSEVEKKTGCKPLLYTYSSFFEQFLAASLENYPLWLADYAEHPKPPHDDRRWIIWQNSQSATEDGITGHVDTNILRPGLTLDSIKC